MNRRTSTTGVAFIPGVILSAIVAALVLRAAQRIFRRARRLNRLSRNRIDVIPSAYKRHLASYSSARPNASFFRAASSSSIR
jgi:hypothetical protein